MVTSIYFPLSAASSFRFPPPPVFQLVCRHRISLAVKAGPTGHSNLDLYVELSARRARQGGAVRRGAAMQPQLMIAH